MMTDPYAPGPQGDDEPGCFETALRLLLVLLVLIMSLWAPAQAQMEEEPPPISSTACCWFYLPVVTNPCAGEVCASAAQASGGALAADTK